MEKFLNKLAEDQKLREEFLSQTTPEGAYKVAKPYIGDMTMEEFGGQMVGLAKVMTKAERGELDADDLDSVAGGGRFSDFMGKIQGFASGLADSSVQQGISQGIQTISALYAAGKGLFGRGK